jgi:hypothetical protein
VTLADDKHSKGQHETTVNGTQKLWRKSAYEGFKLGAIQRGNLVAKGA